MTDISKALAMDQIRSIMVTPLNTLTKWASDNDPSGGAVGATTSTFDPNILSDNLNVGQSLVSGPTLSGTLNYVELTTVTALLLGLTQSHTLTLPFSLNIVKAELISIIQQTAVILSRLRNVHLQKFNYPYDVAYYDVTSPAHMLSTFAMSLASIPAPAPGLFTNTVLLADLQAYCNALKTTLETWQNTTLLYTEKYCHSNCHSNCHGNRGRR